MHAKSFGATMESSRELRLKATRENTRAKAEALRKEKEKEAAAAAAAKRKAAEEAAAAREKRQAQDRSDDDSKTTLADVQASQQATARR